MPLYNYFIAYMLMTIVNLTGEAEVCLQQGITT
jgi:hypothetical protein